MYSIAISGPADTLPLAEDALRDARIPVYPADHWAPMPWTAKFPDDTDEWLTVEHEDVDHVSRVVESAGWRLRVHYEVPEKPKPSAEQQLAATVAEMQARIAALEGRSA